MDHLKEFIGNQIEKDLAEQWKIEHARAMECRDVERMLKVGLALYNIFRTADEVWSQRVQTGEAEFSADTVKGLRAAYEWWLLPCDEVNARIRKMEDTPYSFEVAGASEFRNAVRTVRQLMLSPVEPLIAV